MQNERAPAANERPFQIHEWKPTEHGTLKGFVSILLPNGLILNSLQVHESGGRQWIGYPMRGIARNLADSGLAPVLAFSGRKKQRKFENALFDSLKPFIKREGGR